MKICHLHSLEVLWKGPSNENPQQMLCLERKKNIFSRYMYSIITSMARTRMAHLPWMIRTLFFSPYKILPIAQENKYLGIFFLFYHGIVCCVYSLESPH